ncbi:hypothetical protein M404DRAFT_20169 [Pisolithus tinctorius Marx 270]|uniref:Uncharacterized protein n=1 Tax=Pisolithus tinctorius Marx 270 TaxID=870435 RepID=A0A0C3PCI2_PISTI|nr:hypothetical protein M404DRAFT_20169 [Pisolithus tinctorius Marx 270]
MSYTPNTENPGSDYFDNDFHANIDEPYNPSRPYFHRYASSPPRLSEPPVRSPGVVRPISPVVSANSSHGGTYQPLHDSIASATRPYPYPVIRSVPATQRACKDAHKGKSKAHSGPPEPCYDPTFRACNTPLLSQAGYRSPSPLPRAGPSAPAPSVTLAVLSAPSVTPVAPSTGKWVAPEASIFLGYVQLLNDFERWESHGWRAGECHEHLQVLSKIFRSSEIIGKRVHDQVAMAEGSFEAHTYEDIDKANSAILQETLKTQEAVIKIVHEDYGPSLISSFRAFLGRTPVDVVCLEDQAYLRTLTEKKHGRSWEKKPVSEGQYNMDPEEAERLLEMSKRGVTIAGRRLYQARVENTFKPSRTRSHPSRSTDPPVTGSTSSPRPGVTPLEEPSLTLLRHQELYQQLPSSLYLSPPSAKENLVGSFPSIGSIPSTNSPVTDVHALDIGRLTAQLAVATNSEIRSWVQQGLYPPSEDLRS